MGRRWRGSTSSARGPAECPCWGFGSVDSIHRCDLDHAASAKFHIDGNKVLGTPAKAIYDCWGKDLAISYLVGRRKILTQHFDLVDWNALERAMTLWSQMYRDFYTKHITGCCVVRHFEHYITDGKTPTILPCCSEPDKTTHHILLCNNKSRKQLFRRSLKRLEEWMTEADTDPFITKMVCKYLKRRMGTTMKSLFKGRRLRSSLRWQLVKTHSTLGWRNFTEGGISSNYERLQARHYKRIGSQRSSKK